LVHQTFYVSPSVEIEYKVSLYGNRRRILSSLAISLSTAKRQSRLTPLDSRAQKASALSMKFSLPVRQMTRVLPSGTAPIGERAQQDAFATTNWVDEGVEPM
jgi:hypothetical protein